MNALSSDHRHPSALPSSKNQGGLVRRSPKSEAAPGLRSSKSEAGFTLVELTVVIMIIAILGAAVAGGVVYASRKAAVTATNALFQRLSIAINTYQQDYGAYPPDRNPAFPGPGGWDGNYYSFDVGLAYCNMPAETLPYFLSGMFEHPNIGTVRDKLKGKTSYLSFRQKELKRTGYKFGTVNLVDGPANQDTWTRTDGYPELVDVWGSPIYYIHTVDPTNPNDPDNPRVNNVTFDLVSRGPDRATGNGDPGKYEDPDETVVAGDRTAYPNRDNIIGP